MIKIMLGKKAQDINWVYIILTVLFLLTIIVYISSLKGGGSSIGEGLVDWFRNLF
jgi:hypothetical protein